MSGRITASVDDTPGQARIKVLDGALTPDAQLRIRREGWDAGVLGPQGWQAGDVLLRPLGRRVEGNDLVLLLGMEATRHLERGVYLMSVPAAKIEEEAVVWPDISAFGGTRIKPVHVVIQKIDGNITPDSKTTRRDTTRSGGEEAQETRVKRPKVWRFALGGAVIVVLLLAGAAALWYHPAPVLVKKTTMVLPPSEPVPPPKPPVVVTAPDPAGLSGLSVTDAIAKAPNSDAIFAEGERRLNGTQKDDGLLLVEAAADKGDAKAMLALGHLYDPVDFDFHGPIPAPDMREAAEYYRKAVRAGSSDAIGPRAALQAYLQSKSQEGDLDAKFALQDFWP
jgi:hypothetical protein